MSVSSSAAIELQPQRAKQVQPGAIYIIPSDFDALAIVCQLHLCPRNLDPGAGPGVLLTLSQAKQGFGNLQVCLCGLEGGLRRYTGEIQARDLVRHLILRSLDLRFRGLDGGACCLERRIEEKSNTLCVAFSRASKTPNGPTNVGI